MTNGIILQEQIIKNLDFEFYNKVPALRASGISDLTIPKKYWYKYISDQHQSDEEKKSLVIGSALHTLVLETDQFFNRYIIYPDGLDRRTKEGKISYQCFLELSQGKKILKREDFDLIQGMANSMKSHPRFGVIFNMMENKCIEDSLFWEFDKNIWLKSRPDFYNDDIIVDVKTTSCDSPEDFIKSIANYGYHRQAAMQIDGLSYLTKRKYNFHIIFVVEKNPPYLCAMYQLDEEAINQGRNEYMVAAGIYANCLKYNDWPGYSDLVEEVSLPHWYKNNVAL